MPSLPIPIVTSKPLSPTNPQPNQAQSKDISTPKEKHAGGRPCGFCENKDRYLNITIQYIESGKDEKNPRVLFLNELAMKLDVDRDTITDWKNKKTKDDDLEHPEFYRLIKALEEMQEFRLQQRILGRHNPTGAIFLLKTKHGYIESEKQIIAGDKNEPLQIEIISEGAHHVE